MILVDSSVLIRFLGSKQDHPAVRALNGIIADGIPYAICPYVYQEVLQGTADEATFRRVKTYLDLVECLWLPAGLETFAEAARLYWDLRRGGCTIRSTVDVLIALTAIEHDAILLHDDRDFDVIADAEPRLRTLSAGVTPKS